MLVNASIHAEDYLLDTSFELTVKGVVKMKIAISLILGSGDNIKEIMKRVDDDVSHMSSLPTCLSTLARFEVNQGYYGPSFAGCMPFKFKTYNSKSADRSD